MREEQVPRELRDRIVREAGGEPHPGQGGGLLLEEAGDDAQCGMLHNWPHLYANALVDLSDLSDWKTKDQGAYYPHCDVATKVGKQRLALPYGTGGILTSYRKSWA